MCRDSSVHRTSVLRPSCPPPAWQGSEERTNRLLLLYRVLEAEGAYGGGGVSLYCYHALFVSCQLPKIASQWQSSHISFISSPTVPKCEGYRETQESAPSEQHRGVRLQGGGDAHLLVGDLQQLQHHGVGAHVPEQALLLLPALPHGCALLNTEFAESDQNLVGRKIKVSPQSTSLFWGSNLQPGHDSSWYFTVYMEFAKGIDLKHSYLPYHPPKVTSVSDGCVN